MELGNKFCNLVWLQITSKNIATTIPNSLLLGTGLTRVTKGKWVILPQKPQCVKNPTIHVTVRADSCTDAMTKKNKNHKYQNALLSSYYTS